MKLNILQILVFLLSVFLSLPGAANALVSEGRPGVPYFGNVLFLQKKVIENGKVVAASLAYADPRDDTDLCLNRIDVYGGLEKFIDIPEKKWVLVDYELQSVLISEGFAGDADVKKVSACPDVDTCLALSEELSKDPEEQQRRANFPRPKATEKVKLEDIQQRLEIGRKLVKAARCRGCHTIEGIGPDYAPSLTWKRSKYEVGWLKSYIKSPYRMRPGMSNLMMLNYTSPNAKPSLRQEEIEVVAGYLERVAIASAPSSDQRRELWEDYDCYSCHVRIYKSAPLTFKPTVVPDRIRNAAESSATVQLCLSCHAFGDMRVAEGSSPVNAYAPDLLLAIEKLTLDFIANYLPNPSHLVPSSRMPALGLSDAQINEIRGFAREVKMSIDDGSTKPIHVYYEIERKNEH